MRRPLNWVVVCLSLLFLLVNLSLDRKRGVTAETAQPALANNEYAGVLSAAKPEVQFGYVRADGSFVPLSQQPDSPAAAAADPALYTWSSPVL